MILLLGFSFLAGLITILTPCMWPMLPIVLSANIKGQNHWRPLGITIGVMASFAVFTLSVSYLVRLFHFDPNILRIFAVIVIVFLGLTLLVPALTRITEGLVSRLTGKLGMQRQKGNDFQSGLFTGVILGIVWSPCGGPILASIAVLAATGMVNLQVILVTLAYVTGVGLPLFFFTYGGQRLVTRTRFVSSYTGRIQQVFGIIMILTAIAIYFNYDKVLQVKFLQAFPQLGQTLNGFESSNIVRQQLDALKGKISSTMPVNTSDLFNANTPAPEFVGITKWLNTDHPLTLKELKGKVVLIDFWTYTCINCIRALPHVKGWYEKYKNDGFIVIGVHTPEFEFEHDTNNVLNAIKMYNIQYPVPQDNNYATWNAYNNQYWPADYLIDAKGTIRHVHFGEGEYDKTEMAIRALLQEAGKHVTGDLTNIQDQTPIAQLSPETYLGSERMQYLYPNGSTNNGTQNFTADPGLPVNTFSYGGIWTIASQYGMSGNSAVIYLHFNANKVHLVMNPAQGIKNTTVKVILDGKPVDVSNAGGDVQNGVVTLDEDRLYTLIDLHGKSGDHILKLEFQTPSTQVFAFTFS